MDSQTVKGTELGGEHGYDAAKKLSGGKRHIIVDMLGLLLVVSVSAASSDDGKFAPQVLGGLTVEHRTRLDKVWADAKYHNKHFNESLEKSRAGYHIEVVDRPVRSKTFVLLQRRPVVERTFVWLVRYRRHSRAYEVYSESRRR